jgi:hypothetical protein
MNVGYFSIPNNAGEAIINLDILKNLPVVESGKFIRHVNLKNELTIRMDGKNRQALIAIE